MQIWNHKKSNQIISLFMDVSIMNVGMKRSKDCSAQFVKQASAKKGLGNHNGNIHKKKNHLIALFVI